MLANIKKIKENTERYESQTFDIFEIWANCVYLLKQSLELSSQEKLTLSNSLDYNARNIIEDMARNENTITEIIKNHLNEDFKYRLNGTIEIFNKLVELFEKHNIEFSYTREYNWPAFSGCEMPEQL